MAPFISRMDAQERSSIVRIDGLVNYSSYMQHFNPLEARPAQDAVSRVEGVKPVQQVENKPQEQKPEMPEGIVRKTSGAIASYREPLEDIQIDFGKGSAAEEPVNEFSSGDIKKAISHMEQDSALHGYQYFVGNNSAQTLVNNEDGVVTKLSA